MKRSTFRKITHGGGFPLYEELPTHAPYADGITDKGDYYEVVIQTAGSVTGRTFDMPIVLVMGDGAVFDECYVRGFANVYHCGSIKIRRCHFDATDMRTVTKRQIVEFANGRDGVEFDSFVRGQVMA